MVNGVALVHEFVDAPPVPIYVTSEADTCLLAAAATRVAASRKVLGTSVAVTVLVIVVVEIAMTVVTRDVGALLILMVTPPLILMMVLDAI